MPTVDAAAITVMFTSCQLLRSVCQAVIPLAANQQVLLEAGELPSLLGAYNIFGDLSSAEKEVVFTTGSNGQGAGDPRIRRA